MLAEIVVSTLSPALLVVLAVAGCSLAWLVLGNANSPIVAAVAIFMSSASLSVLIPMNMHTPIWFIISAFVFHYLIIACWDSFLLF